MINFFKRWNSRGICTKYCDYSFTVKCNQHRTTSIQCVTKSHVVFWRMLMTVQIVPAPPMFCIYSPGLTCMRYICTSPSSDAHRHRCVNNPNWQTESRSRLRDHIHDGRKRERERKRETEKNSAVLISTHSLNLPVYRLWRNFYYVAYIVLWIMRPVFDAEYRTR